MPSADEPVDYKQIFESAPALFLVLGTDANFTIVDASDAYLHATLTQRQAIVGRGLFDVFPANHDEEHATGTINLRASLERVLAGRRADTMAVQKYDIRRPPQAGGGFETRYWSPVNSPVLSPDGDVRWIIHRVEDVTDMVVASGRLENGEWMRDASANEIQSSLTAAVGVTDMNDSLRRHERLADVNPDLRRRVLEQQTLRDVLPIAIANGTYPECRQIGTNRAFAATLGLRPDANASKTATAGERPTNFRILTPDGDEVPDDRLPMQGASREGREVMGVEFDVVHDDGRVVRLLEYAAPLFDEEGTPRGAVGAFVD